MITRIHPIFLALQEAARPAPDGSARSMPVIRPLADQHDDILSGWRIRRQIQPSAARSGPGRGPRR